ncbi:Putative protein of unknown function [Podospora comata]|uniref:CTLH domain-containing protein n=1 Tax=Podospora comata TaxID=48703 RepID=A0ABY6S0A4_PODCO|nr:Putative protein of unknown function [Podospora comata]
MSNWQAFQQQGHLDPDFAFREHIFAQFRQAAQRQSQAAPMTSSTATATPKYAFEARVGDTKTPKNDINALILDYLTMEGYPGAAANFSKEANLAPQQADPSIKTRQEIQHAIHSGDIETAITALNTLDSDILDKNPELHFSLLRLQLVELIRQCYGGDITPALDFATQQVAPRASINEQFRVDLERAMSLLFFDHDSNLSPELKDLLSSDLRRKTATKVNEAVLVRQDQRREAAIRALVRMRAWAESSARSSKIKDLPPDIDIGLNGENAVEFQGLTETNGHEPMITT